MTFKKNRFSVSVWILFTLFTVMVLSDALYRTLTNYWIITEFYINAGIALGGVIVFVVIFYMVLKWNVKIPLTNPKLLEAFVFTCVCGLGIGLRCFYLFETDKMQIGMEENIYFNTAQINGTELTAYAPGMPYLYLLILRGLFYVFGNHFALGLIFQIVVQYLAIIIWYLAIRKIAGILAACVFLTGVMLMPQSIIMGIQYSPNMLFLLFAGIVLLLITGLLKREYVSKDFKWHTYVYAALTGAGIGFLSFADVTGLIFFFLVFALCFVDSKDDANYDLDTKKVKRRLLTLFSIFGSGVLTFLLLNGFFTNTEGFDLLNGLKTWSSMYSFKGLKDMSSMFFDREPDIDCIIVLFLLVLGSFAFFKDKKNEKQLFWLFILIGAAVIYIGTFYSENMKPDALLLFIKLALTGVGMRVLFQFKDVSVATVTVPFEESLHTLSEAEEVVKEKRERKVKVEMPKQPIMNVQPANEEKPLTTEAGSNTETVSNMEQPVKIKPTLFENPLPLPKKHVKKIMSYGITVPRYKMKYDISVADDDDFDIQ